MLGMLAAHGPVVGAAAACLGIRFFVGCALIIPMIIQSIRLLPSGAVWTDEAANVSRLDPAGAVLTFGMAPLGELVRPRRVAHFAWLILRRAPAVAMCAFASTQR
jgi:hypothetical protein